MEMFIKQLYVLDWFWVCFLLAFFPPKFIFSIQIVELTVLDIQFYEC